MSAAGEGLAGGLFATWGFPATAGHWGCRGPLTSAALGIGGGAWDVGGQQSCRRTQVATTGGDARGSKVRVLGESFGGSVGLSSPLLGGE